MPLVQAHKRPSLLPPKPASRTALSLAKPFGRDHLKARLTAWVLSPLGTLTLRHRRPQDILGFPGQHHVSPLESHERQDVAVLVGDLIGDQLRRLLHLAERIGVVMIELVDGLLGSRSAGSLEGLNGRLDPALSDEFFRPVEGQPERQVIKGVPDVQGDAVL